MAPFAMAGSPALKLIVDTRESRRRWATRRRSRPAFGFTTVTLIATAFAVAGTPHTVLIVKSRSTEAGRIPPKPVRVSAARHGVTA